MELELDLTPSLIEKTNDPVRMYLREMGTVPLLTREGEVAIAKRIERGKLAVIKSISRTPTIAKRILTTGDQLRAGERTIRELVIFSDEEITDEVIDERKEEVLAQIEEVRKARANFVKLNEKTEATPAWKRRGSGSCAATTGDGAGSTGSGSGTFGGEGSGGIGGGGSGSSA